MAISNSLARLAASLLATLRNRIELASVEIEEETLRLYNFLLQSLIALFFFGLAFTMLMVLVIVLFWEEHRIAVLVSLALLFGFIATCLALTAKYTYQNKPPMLHDTLAELAKDMAALRAAAGEQPPEAKQ